MMPADQSKEDIQGVQLKQIVALSLENVPEYKIAEQLKLSRYAVRKIRNGEEFKKLLKEIGDSAVESAREKFKAGMESMAPDAIEALRHNLKEKKVEAVRLYAEIIGAKEKKEETANQGTLQVFLPGANQPEVIEVKSDVESLHNDG